MDLTPSITRDGRRPGSEPIVRVQPLAHRDWLRGVPVTKFWLRGLRTWTLAGTDGKERVVFSGDGTLEHSFQSKHLGIPISDLLMCLSSTD